MLPKNQRLTSNRIEYLLKKGKKNGNSFLTVKYLQNRQKKSRFCAVVSLKVTPKAVQRNRLRRQLFEIFRLHPDLPSVPTDIVVIAKLPLTKLNFQELTKTLVQTLQNITSSS